MKECPSCNDTFDTEHGLKSHHARVHGESLVDPDIHECDNCGENFEGHPGNTNNYCSRECADVHRTLSGVNHHNYVEYTKYECEWCGESFRGKPSNKNRFCSRECNSEWQSEAFSGEDCWLYGKDGAAHPRYSGGRVDDYPEDWSDVREAVIERDDGECTDCGIGRVQCQSKHGYDLDVHHIEPIDSFDDHTNAHSLDNLTTMCRSCHRRNEHNA